MTTNGTKGSPTFVEKDIKISTDLVEASRRLLVLLKKVDEVPHLCEAGPTIENALRRYEKFWLPMLAEQNGNGNGKDLIPPLDIHWVWTVHLLAPYFYEKDCKRIVNKVIDHKLLGEKDTKQALDRAQRMWQEKYPQEPFQVNLTAPTGQPVINGISNGHTKDKNSHDNSESKIHYDLRSAIFRQKLFYYQVSLPHYQDRGFLKAALVRYKKYLYLKQKNPDEFLVPCYDFDLVWHSHQVHPLTYCHDTTNILGRMFNHDDSVNDRSPDSKLDRSDTKTRQLWKETFDEEFVLCGAMYRGNPPCGKLNRLLQEQVFQLSSKRADVIIQRLELGNVCPSDLDKFALQLSLGYKNNTKHRILKLKGPPNMWSKNGGDGLVKFTFDTGAYNNIHFELIDKRGFLCCSGNDVLGSHIFPFRQIVESTPIQGQTVTKGLSLTGHTQTQIGSISMTAVVGCPKQGPCHLSMQNGTFQTCTMPENIEQLWGPIPLARLPEGTPNTCIVASHR
jgi:hypothetical protein